MFLINDNTLASNNLSLLKGNILERIQKVIMTTDDKGKDERLE